MGLRISGHRQLKTLSGLGTRPTLARVREALFNIWQGSIENCQWLDLCSGSGSMGAEALNHGALLVVAIELNPRACAIIKENWQQIAHPDQSFQIWRGDVVAKLKTLEGQKFERIYFDPPYASNLYESVLKIVSEKGILTPDGEIAVEHNPQQWEPREIPNLEICRQKVYGNTALTFYRPISVIN